MTQDENKMMSFAELVDRSIAMQWARDLKLSWLPTSSNLLEANFEGMLPATAEPTFYQFLERIRMFDWTTAFRGQDRDAFQMANPVADLSAFIGSDLGGFALKILISGAVAKKFAAEGLSCEEVTEARKALADKRYFYLDFPDGMPDIGSAHRLNGALISQTDSVCFDIDLFITPKNCPLVGHIFLRLSKEGTLRSGLYFHQFEIMRLMSGSPETWAFVRELRDWEISDEIVGQITSKVLSCAFKAANWWADAEKKAA